MKKKKEIMIELVYDIPALIRIQELSLIEIKKKSTHDSHLSRQRTATN
jgi:hypothetical protein